LNAFDSPDCYASRFDTLSQNDAAADPPYSLRWESFLVLSAGPLAHLMDPITIVTVTGVTGLVSKALTALLERLCTKKHRSVEFQEILLRENVSSTELRRRVEELEELVKHQRTDSLK
jgi:hypothetical protein